MWRKAPKPSHSPRMALALATGRPHDTGEELLALMAELAHLPLSVAEPLSEEINAAFDPELPADGGHRLREAVRRLRTRLSRINGRPAELN